MPVAKIVLDSRRSKFLDACVSLALRLQLSKLWEFTTSAISGRCRGALATAHHRGMVLRRRCARANAVIGSANDRILSHPRGNCTSATFGSASDSILCLARGNCTRQRGACMAFAISESGRVRWLGTYWACVTVLG